MQISKLKKGESLIDKLAEFVKNKPSGVIIGLGALESLTIKSYDLSTKSYREKKLHGPLEVGSFSAIVGMGTEGTMGIHAHIVASDKEFKTYSGHVEQATVGATFEFFYVQSDNEICRYFDKNIGLNLIK